MHTGSLINAAAGAYRLVDFVGAGGMGEVYRAVHQSLGRVVAIKVLTGAGRVPGLVERFRNEARIQATLHHPNIATLYDFLELRGRPCIVMEYIDGETLDRRIARRGGLPPAEALGQFARMVDAVAYLHAQGVIHRDLKSTNVKITSDGQVKLLDFGIAKGPVTPKLTATGHMVGTIDYMAPEQLSMGELDARTDVWSLGVILYEMVTGRLPFAAQSVPEVMRRILDVEYFRASAVRPGLPPAIDELIAGCLSRRPADRFAAAARLGDSVTRVASGLSGSGNVVPVRSPAAGPAAAAAVRAGRSALGWLGRAGQRMAVSPRALRGVAGAVTLAAIAFIVYQTWPTGPVGPPAPPPPGPAAGPVAAGRPCGFSDEGPAHRLRTIEIDVYEGSAEVYCQGRLLASTPLRAAAPLGAVISVVLKRAGYHDRAVDFTVTERPKHSYTLQRRSANAQYGARGAVPRGPVDPAIAGWLPLSLAGLFRRRRPRAAKETRVGEAVSGARATNLSLTALGDAETGIEIGIKSDPGCVRDRNEDSIGFCHPAGADELGRAGVLLVVADGMGGHTGGEVASSLAVRTVIEHYAADNGDPQAALSRAVRLAHDAIRSAAQRQPALQGMGTTCTTVLIRQGRAYCAHVGDSRLYLVRDNGILQLTEDHSAVFDLVKRGMIDRDVARQHPDRNVIVRALGSRAEVEVAAWPRPLFVRDQDRFVVSSDGLHDLVADDEILAAVTAGAPEDACGRLVKLARERGGFDNVSVGILAISSVAAPGETDHASEEVEA